MPIFNEDAESIVIFAQEAVQTTVPVLISYGTLEAANTYFDARLRNRVWKKATSDDKKKALTEATRIIDGLNFEGDKLNPDQLNQCPRVGMNQEDIEKACYEIAFRLIDGWDPDIEIENLNALSHGVSSIKSNYERSFALDHLRAGIPSTRAWMFLRQYLKDPQKLLLLRVD